MNSNRLINPVSDNNRIVSLDVLRGFAVLGILVMNIQSFSMPGAAYLNPSAYGDLTGINRWVWMVSHYLANMKFMTIFSILFGAGIFLFSTRIQDKGLKAGPIHYRRIFWLLVIGLAHAYLFWYGDILVTYALCALTAFLYRKLKPGTLLILGLLIMGVASVFYLFSGFSVPYMPPEQLEGIMHTWRPSVEVIRNEIASYKGGFADQMSVRVPAAIMMQTLVFFIFMGWRAGGLMLIGMALFKWDVLSGKRSARFYLTGLLFGLIIGITLITIGIRQNFAHEWKIGYSMFFGAQFNYWGSLFMAFAFICGIMLLCQKQFLTRLTSRWAATGKMAFTNYLGQTLICTFIFYGHELGLFGDVDRWQQILIVFAIWILQLLLSPIWLWRSLTYWKIQPFRIK